jgi:hypothetical protein
LVANFNRRLYINGEQIDEDWVQLPILAISPIDTAPVGFWRNETSIFLRAPNWLYLEGTAFNYSCMPTNLNPKYGTGLNLLDIQIFDGLPTIQQCTMLIKIPPEIYDVKFYFCTKVMIIHNTESNNIGIRTNGESCMVKVQDCECIQNLFISEGSYRFFRQLSYIACSFQEGGLYTNFSNGELVLINALDMGYDEAVQVVTEVGSVGNNRLIIDTSGFSSLLSLKSNYIFLIVGIVVGVLIMVIITIIIICLLCNYFPKRIVVV